MEKRPSKVQNTFRSLEQKIMIFYIFWTPVALKKFTTGHLGKDLAGIKNPDILGYYLKFVSYRSFLSFCLLYGPRKETRW